MVPPTIRSKLAGLRTRERLLTFAWGAACWFAILLILVFICGFIDWLIDRQRDTPYLLRVGMFFVQAGVAFVAALLFLLVPQIRRLPDTLMALWVEEKMPQFEHRLISAVQLNEPDADLQGMSIELVGVVTKEAEKETTRAGGFAQIANHMRLLWGAGILTPVFFVFVLPFLIWPGLCFALLARQLLIFDVDIPHSVTLTAASEEHWPIGDDIPIFIRVEGEWDKDMKGTVYAWREGQRGDSYPLTYHAPTQDGQGAIFVAEVKPSLVDIYYTARLADGRTRAPSKMSLVPRPSVTDQAFVILPAYCGLRPKRPGMNDEDRRYEEPQSGDVVGIPGSSVRVQATIQKQVSEAWIELLEFDPVRAAAGIATADAVRDNQQSFELVREKHRMALSSDGRSATFRFDLAPGLSGYRILVVDPLIKDKRGHANHPPTRRSVRLTPEPPPNVSLLRDSFSDSSAIADFDIEGLPVIIGGKIRIPYEASGRYGLGKAQVMYRVLKKHESGNEPGEEEDWIKANLPEIPPPKDPFNAFNPKTGVFFNTEFDQQVEFHAVPSRVPDKMLGRTQGGGRVFLPTAGLLDRKTGKPLQLNSGDQIEYCIKVYAMNREPEASTPYFISESRVAVVMTLKDFEEWRRQVSKEDERVKDLEAKQKGVFGPK